MIPFYDAIYKFEAARRKAGHTALLSEDQLADIRQWPSGQDIAGLASYILGAYEGALELADARNYAIRRDGTRERTLPPPVIPSVQFFGSSSLVVSHETCTGNTIVRLTAYPNGYAALDMYRRVGAPPIAESPWAELA